MGKLRIFEIVFDNNKSVYYPSEQVCGKCIVDLRGDIKMKALRVLMRGVAKVHWTESRSTGNRLGAYTEHYNAEIEYFLKQQVLFGSESSEGQEVLTEGRHEFHFSFQLPSGGISTSFEGKYGSIRYWLKAEIEKPWTFNHKAKKAFTVICPIDINRNEYLVPVHNNVEKVLCCWCCTSGPISLYARSDRKGYCPGESIAIVADFENLSSRTVTPYATLHQTQTFVAGGKTKTRHSKYTTVAAQAIQPGHSLIWGDGAQLLKIPAVSPSIINCCLIRIDYAVRITLQIPGAYNLSMDLPVLIGTVPLRSFSYRSMPFDLEVFNDRLDPQMMMYPPAPPYTEVDMNSLPIEPPPTYAECVEGSVDIADDDDGDVMGNTRFTPMYAYVHGFQYQPPPLYHEICDPARMSECHLSGVR